MKRHGTISKRLVDRRTTGRGQDTDVESGALRHGPSRHTGNFDLLAHQKKIDLLVQK
jgi:hypothetical protein